MNFDFNRKLYAYDGPDLSTHPIDGPLNIPESFPIFDGVETVSDRIIPQTRFENFLAKIAKNPNAKELKPKTRIERLLQEIADSMKIIANKQEKFVVTFSGWSNDDSGEHGPTCDKTYEEIRQAYDNGYEVEGRHGDYILPLVSEGSGQFIFASYYYVTFVETVNYGICAIVYNDDEVVINLGGDV